jgi:predicted transcriptional regulator
MPNQRVANIKVTTVAIDAAILEQCDQLAAMCERSRNKVIELVLRNEVPRYIEKDLDPARPPKRR